MIDLKEFSKADFSQWKKKVIQELKGQSFSETLITSTLEDIDIQPLYTSENHTENSILPKENAGWKIVSTLNNEKYYKGVEMLKTSLENAKNTDFPLWITDININSNDFKNLDFKQETLLNISPVSTYFEKGTPIDFSHWNDFLNSKNTIPFVIDASLYQESGATMIQQIAFAIGEALEYIENYDKSVIEKIYFKFAISENYFFEIAKLRAFRFLWEQICVHYNVENQAKVFAINTKRNKSVLDKESNLIRTSIEAMASVIGGADYLYIPNYNLNDSTDKIQNISKNLQLILKGEAYLNQVIDPYAGSYFVEHITTQLGKKATELLKQIEAKGGIISFYENGVLQELIEKSHNAEINLIQNNHKIVIGVNKFVNDLEDQSKIELLESEEENSKYINRKRLAILNETNILKST